MEVINKQDLIDKIKGSNFLSNVDVEYICSVINAMAAYNYDAPSMPGYGQSGLQTGEDVQGTIDEPGYETESQEEKEAEKGMSVYERLQVDRRRCTDYISGLFLGQKSLIDFQNLASLDALRPFNPVTGERIDGGDRLKFAVKAQQYSYADPRWASLKQWNELGYRIKKDAKATKRERWIFSEKRPVTNRYGMPVLDEKGNQVMENIPLDNPRLSYENWFNAAQVWDPKRKSDLETISLPESTDSLESIAGALISCCPCSLQHVTEGHPLYDRDLDMITIRADFFNNDPGHFVQSLIRTLAYATGHSSRNYRFTAPSYIENLLLYNPEKLSNGPRVEPGTVTAILKEAMVTEIAAVFMAADMGIKLSGPTGIRDEIYGQMANMIRDQGADTLYRIARDADKAVKQVEHWYTKVHKLDLSVPVEKKRNQTYRNQEDYSRGDNSVKTREQTYRNREDYSYSRGYSGGKTWNPTYGKREDYSGGYDNGKKNYSRKNGRI